jgi:hypothetical protein
LAIPHIFANISIGCKLNQVFQSHRIDRCVQMNLNDHMVQPLIFLKRFLYLSIWQPKNLFEEGANNSTLINPAETNYNF